MACQTSAGVAAYENCGIQLVPGLQPYNSNDPNANAITAAVAQSKPSGAGSDYQTAGEACLRAGGILYWTATGAPCQFPTVSGGVTSGQVVGLSGSAASGIFGGLGAAGIIGGAATLGITAAISLAVGGIETIFANHAAAVANENHTICQVAGYFNGAKAQIDAAVRSGQITSDQGVTYLTQVANQAKSGLASIMKVCNASCVYGGILQAFINFARTWYDSIAPRNLPTPQAPGGPPTSWGTPPGGVTTSPSTPAPPQPVRSLPGNTYLPTGPGVVPQAPGTPLTSNQNLPGNPGASDWLNLGYNQPTGQAAQGADVPNTTVLPSWLLPAAAIILIVLVLQKA